MHAAQLDMAVFVFLHWDNYVSALALDSMRWVTGARTVPSVGECDLGLDAFAVRGVALLTRPDARLRDTPMGPAVVTPEVVLVLECGGWANV